MAYDVLISMSDATGHWYTCQFGPVDDFNDTDLRKWFNKATNAFGLLPCDGGYIAADKVARITYKLVEVH